MNLSKFFKKPYTVPVKYFLQYFESGKYEKACCEIKYSFDTCLQLCTEEFFQFLIEQATPSNNLDAIFCTIAYSLNKQHLSINSLINPKNFLQACTNCNAYVIALIVNQCPIKISPLSNDGVEESALKRILDRNDPQLLLKCIQLVPDFVETEPQRTVPLYYVLEHKLDKLVDDMWIIVNSFGISENDLLIIARNWSEYSSGPLIPILKELYEKHMFQYQLNIEISRTKKDTTADFITESTNVTDINCLDVKEFMSEADKLRRFINERKQTLKKEELHYLKFLADPQSTSVLMVLPYELMRDEYFMLLPYDKVYMENSLINDEAVGEGPVQDLFNAYFRQISSADFSYFVSNENTTMLLPTEKRGNDKEFHEKKCIFYGLGVVFLKVLIDSRPIGNFQDESIKNKDEGSLNCSLHPWIFQALLQKMETDPKKIFNESLLYDNKFYNIMYQQIFEYGEKETINEFVEKIKENKMYLDSRGDYYKAMHDGFFLNYIEGLTPSEFKENLKLVKDKLKDFYKLVQTISPKALQFLLVGPSIINAEFLLSRFEYMPFEKFDTSGDGKDTSMTFIGKNADKGKIYNDSISYFKAVMIDWCKEKYQQNLKNFLKYLSGVPSLSPLYQRKWIIAFDFSFEKNKILMTWACDNQIRSPLFESVEQCKEILLSTITLHQLDPVNRDIF